MEAAPLSADEETDTQTPVSVKGTMKPTESVEMDWSCALAGCGRTIKGGAQEVLKDSPLNSEAGTPLSSLSPFHGGSEDDKEDENASE